MYNKINKRFMKKQHTTNISVALCTYNGQDYINEQISSILSQTKKVDEIVICDDCSSDNTVQIIKRIQKKYPNLIRLYQNKNNKGYRKNFDDCYRMCKGEYVFSCDQDDIWNKNKVEKIMNSFKKDTVLVFTDAALIDKNGKEIGQSLWENLGIEYKTICNIEEYKRTIKKRFVVTGATMAFRKSMYNQVNVCEYTCEHDALIAFVAPIFGNVVALNEKLTKYRRHGKNTTVIGPINKEAPIKKRTISEKLKLNFTHIKGNGRYFRFECPLIMLKPVYNITKNHNDAYSNSYNEEYSYFNSLFKMSKMNRLLSVVYLTIFICNKNNRRGYKKYKPFETIPIIKDYTYFLLARDYQ